MASAYRIGGFTMPTLKSGRSLAKVQPAPCPSLKSAMACFKSPPLSASCRARSCVAYRIGVPCNPALSAGHDVWRGYLVEDDSRCTHRLQAVRQTLRGLAFSIWMPSSEYGLFGNWGVVNSAHRGMQSGGELADVIGIAQSQQLAPTIQFRDLNKEIGRITGEN